MSFEDWTSGEIERLALEVYPRRPSPNQSIFKYVGLNTKRSWDLFERLLKSSELVGSTFNSLNDPFELSPYQFDDLRPAAVASAVGYNPMLNRVKNLPFEPEEVFADVDKYRSQAKDYFSKIQRDARVVAFCERSDSPLLWSHYANSYQGACLHFVGGAFRRRTLNIGYVTYADHRPIYPLSLALALSARTRSLYSDGILTQSESDKMIFYTKAADWSYEREVRIVYNASKESSVSFAPDGLLSVIIGPRMTEESQERLRRTIAASQVPHLPVRSASLSTNSFSVEIE